jgi:phenol/toluene 2-monooxygenase (NADH) P1/A1
MAGYQLKTLVIEPKRNTFDYLVDRFGDRPATRYQEGSYNVQSVSNFHYRPTWDPDHELYDPDYSALKLSDPYGYKDPRQFYYTPYVSHAAERFESFAQTLKYVEERRLLDKMPENWHVLLIGSVLPLRHYESGAQLILSNASRFAFGTTVAQAAAFAGFDRVGNAQLLSLIGLSMAGGAADTLSEAKKNWLYSEYLQGLRRYLEELLAERDWVTSFIGLDLADVQLYPMLYTHLDERALARGAGAYSLFARHFNDWFASQRIWLTALLKAWVEDPEHGEANRQALEAIIGRWYPQASAAVHSLAQGVAESAGSTTVVAAAARAAAEAAGELAKYGIHVKAAQGAGS